MPALTAGAICFFLFISVASAAEVRLAWDPPKSVKRVEGYQIQYWKKGAEQTKKTKTINGKTENSCKITGLAADTVYFFRARSYGKDTASVYTDPISHRVPLSDENNSDSANAGGSSGDGAQKDAGNNSSNNTDDRQQDSADNTINNPEGSDGRGNNSDAGKTDSGLPPHRPVLISPSGEREFETGKPVVLETQVYAHPDGSPHIETYWQIRRIDKRKPVYEKTCTRDLTYHKVEKNLQSGMKYAARAGFRDMESGLIRWSEETFFVVGEKCSDGNAFRIPPGQARQNYEMISSTVWTTASAEAASFSPLENADNDEYRIAAWDPAMGESGGYREHTLSGLDPAPGRSYWVLSRNGMDIEFEGIPVTTAEDVYVPLDYNFENGSGWNMIAVPNEASYYRGDIEVVVYDDSGDILQGPLLLSKLPEDNEYIDVRIWEWQNGETGGYKAHDSDNFKLEPRGGYWVKARNENVSLCFPYNTHARLSGPKRMLAGWWQRGIEWTGGKIFTGMAHAESSFAGDDDTPPMPPAVPGESSGTGDIGESSPSSGSSRDSGGGSGCFIGTVAGIEGP